MNRTAVLTVGAFMLLVLGFVCGRMLEVPGITMSRELNPLHLLSLVATVFVAVVVTTIIEDSRGKQRVRRELVCQFLERAWALINDVDAQISDGRVLCVKAPSLSKRLARVFTATDEAMAVCDISATVSLSQLHGSTRELGKLLTTTPARGDTQVPLEVKVEDGYYIYEPVRLRQIELEVDSLAEKVLKLQIQISSRSVS